jgi:glycosyltransferase involved in cell wall biosynthesis
MKPYQFAFVLPAFNSQDFIAKAIESILQQPGDDYQLIVIDDGSTDNTYALLKEQLSHHTNVLLSKQHNQGPNVACLNAIQHCSAEYIVLMAADDCLRPDYLKNIRRILVKNNSLDAIFGTSCSISCSGKKKYSSKTLSLQSPIKCFEQFILGELSIASSGALFKRALFIPYINHPTPYPHNLDVAFLAHCLLNKKCYKSDDVFIDVFDRGNDRYRNNISTIKEEDNVVTTMFDPNLMHHNDAPRLLAIKKRFTSKHLCSRGRSFYRANMFEDAYHAYAQASHHDFTCLFKLNNLKRFILSYLKR